MWPRPAARDFRLRVALLMAGVSLASAYATHIATERAGTAANLNGLASQQSAEEEQVEQQVDAIIAQDLRLTAKVDEHWHTYLTSLAESNEVSARDPAQAAQLDLRAQASADHVFQLWPFFRGAVPSLAGFPPPEGQAATYDADAARSTLRIQDWRTFRASSVLTRNQAAEAVVATSTTVLIVMLLVGGLFLLTLAHLFGSGPRGLALAGIGAIVALAACGWFALLDPLTAIPLLVGAVMLAAVLVLVRLPRVRDWLAGMDDDGAVDAVAAVPSRPGTMATADPTEAPAARFPRFVAVTIAAATLLGAGIGYLQGDASAVAEGQAWQARELGVRAIGAQRAAEERLAVNVEIYQQALAGHIGAWSATHRADHALTGGDEPTARRLEREAERLEELAARLELRSELVDDLGSTGASSEAALRQLRAQVWEESARIAGLQNAANTASQAWGNRAGDYLAALAWLAVAAYLLGLSLVFRERRVRAVLASVGTALILASLLRTTVALTQPEPASGRAAEEAAEAYSAGFVAQARLDPVLAETLFAQAIDLREDFGIARRERAQAILETGSAPGLGYRGAFTDTAVDAAIAELEAARQNGADSAGVSLNMGAMLFHRAIATGSAFDMEESERFTRAGLELGRAFQEESGTPHVNQLIGEANLGLALFAQGKPGEAEAAYRRMAEGARPLAPYLKPYIVAAALAPLERLAEGPLPPSPDAVMAMKSLIVTEVYGIEVQSPAHLDGARAEIFASILQWRAQIADFDPERDHLFVQWYRLDPVVQRWSTLPLLSGPVALAAPTPDFGGQFQADLEPGAYWGNTNRVLYDVPASCVRPGRYRVELYLNGQLQGSAEADSPAEAYEPVLARHIGVAMCAPADWEVSAEPGQSIAAIAPDGSRGIAVFRVHQPRTADVDARNTATDRVLASRSDALPRGLAAGVPIDGVGEPPVFGRNDGLWRLHEYGDGLAKSSATFVFSGAVLVVVIHGPEAWVVSAEASTLVQSLINPY